MVKKVCRDCKTIKNISEFYYNKTLENYFSYCNPCFLIRKNKNRKERAKSLRGHLYHYLESARFRAKRDNLPIDIDLDYLESIATEKCPVFGIDFDWGRNGLNKSISTPSLDKLIPEKGYVKGNVAFISNKANIIKQDLTNPKELYAVADWMWEKLIEVNTNGN